MVDQGDEVRQQRFMRDRVARDVVLLVPAARLLSVQSQVRTHMLRTVLEQPNRRQPLLVQRPQQQSQQHTPSALAIRARARKVDEAETRHRAKADAHHISGALLRARKKGPEVERQRMRVPL